MWLFWPRSSFHRMIQNRTLSQLQQQQIMGDLNNRAVAHLAKNVIVLAWIFFQQGDSKADNIIITTTKISSNKGWFTNRAATNLAKNLCVLAWVLFSQGEAKFAETYSNHKQKQQKQINFVQNILGLSTTGWVKQQNKILPG